MRFEAGWGAAAVVAVAAYLGINSQLAGKPPADASATTRVPSGQTIVVGAKSAFERGPCGDLEEKFRTFLLSPAGIAAPASCYAEDEAEERRDAAGRDRQLAGELESRAAGLQFVIAILPDPLHTHFSLTFDRLAEAVQQGAQDEGYFYDSSWLPWETEESSLGSLADRDAGEARKNARESQPGVLLFRRKPANVRSGGLQQKSDWRHISRNRKQAFSPGKSLLRELSPPHSIPAVALTSAEEPYREGLAVFVVGEEPTSGIHKEQFANAVSWVAALRGEGAGSGSSTRPPVKILGPTFSGSLPSLAQLLAEDTASGEIAGLYADAPEKALPIYSGGITSETLVKWFTDPARKIGKLKFRSFQEGGDQLVERYRQYLQGQGFELSRLAIISEDETAYGGYQDTGDKPPTGPCAPPVGASAGDRQGGPACLYYPRDISALRNAYQKQSVFRSWDGEESAETAKRSLTTDLADPEGKGHDTIRNYSGNQTALSQEAVLQQIVSMLRVHRSEYLVLRGSNPLDQLFLSHFFRLAYPEGRIVIEGSDLLLRRESGAATLSGIMTLSTYPLLPWEHHWTTVSGLVNAHSHRVFAQDLAEGTYVAARFLLHGTDFESGCGSAAESVFLPPNCAGLPVPDYAPPFWAEGEIDRKTGAVSANISSRRPATWLSVLGRDGFWPVAALTETTQPQPRSSQTQRLSHFFIRAGRALISLPRDLWFLLPSAHDGAVAGRPAETPAYRFWPPMPSSMKICLLTLLVWALFHLHCCALPSLTVKPSHRAHFVRIEASSHLCLVLFGSVVVALVPVLLAWGYGAMSPDGEPVPHAWWYRAFLPVSWLMAGLAVSANSWIEERLAPRANFCGKPALPTRYPKLARLKEELRPWFPSMLYVAATYLLYSLIDFSLDETLSSANRIPTYWRSINLWTGVSPLVPLLSLTAGLYCWFWFSLQGLALFGEDRPLLPSLASLTVGDAKDPISQVLSMFSRDTAAGIIERLSRPFAREFCLTAAAIFPCLLAAAYLLAGGVPIRSLGSTDYSLLFCVAMAVCVTLLLSNVWQLLRVWLRLHQLLLLLDRLPLRRTMEAMKGYSWGSVWRMGGNILDMRYKLLSRQLESLTHLGNSPPESKQDVVGWPEQFEAMQVRRSAFAAWYAENWDNWKVRDVSALREFQKCVAETAGMLLSAVLLPEWRKETKSLLFGHPAEKDGDGKKQAAELTDDIRNAEELVCLVYLGFIQNVLGRMRTLVMQLLWLFVAGTISVATYPFDPRPALSGAMLVLFLVLGAVIVVVYSQMHRDATLSLVTNTEPGELGTEFWFKLIGFGAGPLLGLLATVFPELTGSVFSWLQPGLASIK